MGQILSSGENAKTTDDVRPVLSPYGSTPVSANGGSGGGRGSGDVTSRYINKGGKNLDSEDSVDSSMEVTQDVNIKGHAQTSGNLAVFNGSYSSDSNNNVSINNKNIKKNSNNSNRNSTATVASKYMTPGTSFDNIYKRGQVCDNTTQTETIALLSAYPGKVVTEPVVCSDKGMQTEVPVETFGATHEPGEGTESEVTVEATRLPPIAAVTVECSMQTDGAGEVCGCSSSSTSPSLSPQPLRDYLHCDVSPDIHSNTTTTDQHDDHDLLQKAVDVDPQHEDSEALKSLQKVSVVSEDSIVEVECSELKSQPSSGVPDELALQLDAVTSISSDNEMTNNELSSSENWETLYQEAMLEIQTGHNRESEQKLKYETKLQHMNEEAQRMKEVMEQYEQLMLEMTERSSNSVHQDATLSATIAAKTQAENELSKAENNLVQAYRRIEKLKQAVDAYKHNEEAITTSLRDYQAKLDKSEPHCKME